MSRTFVTGDIHGVVDERFDARNLARLDVRPEDTLVILGDTGILWYDDRYGRDSWLVEDLHAAWPGPIAFIDGNHDNHPALADLRVVPFADGMAGQVDEKLMHLLRGHSYALPTDQGTARVATCGGAWSIDRAWRVKGETWWEEEIPNTAELELFENLMDEGDIDYVLTHECPPSCLEAATEESPFGNVTHEDRLTRCLEHIDEDTDFERWYFGHYHENMDVDDAHTLLFDAVIPLGTGLTV